MLATYKQDDAYDTKKIAFKIMFNQQNVIWVMSNDISFNHLPNVLAKQLAKQTLAHLHLCI